MLAYMKGCAPQVAIEFARKVLPHDVRPTFEEVETATAEVADVANLTVVSKAA